MTPDGLLSPDRQCERPEGGPPDGAPSEADQVEGPGPVSPVANGGHATATTPDFPTVSVVVLSKDEPELAGTLDALYAQCAAQGAECLVVDASAGRLDHIRQANPWVRWIDYSGPFWRSSTIPHQRNLGVREAQGRVIAFCDSGGWPDPGWLHAMTTPLLDGTHDLVIGPIASRRTGVYGVLNDVPDGTAVPSAPTGNMGFTVALFEEVAGFEETLFYGSDVDFVWKAADAGHPCVCLTAVGMSMDWGPTSLSMKRSWRYGRAWARQFGRRPERRRFMLRDAPERVAYPVWLAAGVAAFAAAASRRFRWAPLAWLALLAVPLVKNRRVPDPVAVTRDHVIGAVAAIDEATRRLVGELGPVLFIPDDSSPYLAELQAALERQGVPVTRWRGPTNSHAANCALGPLWLLLARWRGVRVAHVHWMFGFSPISSATRRRTLSLRPLVDVAFGRLARWWFEVFLAMASNVGITIVWTAHNLLPHNPVFDDDAAARRSLVTTAGAVIALSEYSAEQVRSHFAPASDVVVIPHGPLALPPSTTTRSAARATLGVSPQTTCISFFGQVLAYKGVGRLIDAAGSLATSGSTSPIAVRVTGCTPEDARDALERQVRRAQERGADVVFCGERVSDDRLSDLLLASDFCAFPFTAVTNSGSVLAALTAGVPVIIPDLPELAHIDEAAVLRYDPESPVGGLADAIVRATAMSVDQQEVMAAAALAFTNRVSWDEIAAATVAVYARAVKEAS